MLRLFTDINQGENRLSSCDHITSSFISIPNFVFLLMLRNEEKVPNFVIGSQSRKFDPCNILAFYQLGGPVHLTKHNNSFWLSSWGNTISGLSIVNLSLTPTKYIDSLHCTFCGFCYTGHLQVGAKISSAYIGLKSRHIFWALSLSA